MHTESLMILEAVPPSIFPMVITEASKGASALLTIVCKLTIRKSAGHNWIHLLEAHSLFALKQ